MRTDPSTFVNPHGLANKVGRLVWHVVWMVLFRPSPWFMGAWRSWLLRLFGAKIGFVRLHSSVRVWAPWRLKMGSHVYVDRDVYLYNAYGLEVGDRVVISFGSVLCTASHDYRRSAFPLTGKQITVGSDVWIAAEAFVAPGVSIADGGVVGARAMVTRDVAAWTVVSGNPAVQVRERVVVDAPEASRSAASGASDGSLRAARA